MTPPAAVRPRLAVVSGGGTGIGRAAASALLAAGCDVLLLGRRRGVLEQTAGELAAGAPSAEVRSQVADVSDPQDVAALAARLRDEKRPVDVLVNNAGSPAVAAAGGLTELASSWLETYRANVVSAVLLTAALEPLLPRPGGRVLLVGSRSALTGEASAAYVAAKAALHGWALSLARQLGPDGITVNVVAPGYTADTELVAGRISPERHARLLTGIAVGRPGAAAEIGAVIGFLCSPEAGFVNGQVLAVDGGRLTPG